MQKKRPLREADVTAESVFFMQRRQILKALGIGAAAATLSSPTQANLLDWFKGNDRLPARALAKQPVSDARRQGDGLQQFL